MRKYFHLWFLVAVFTLTAVTPALAQPDWSSMRVQNRRGARAQRGDKNPYRMLQRFNRMRPRQRQRLLQGLPQNRRQALERRLQKFNKMPERQQRNLIRTWDRLERLPAQDRAQARRMLREFQSMPADRRRALKQELGRLRTLSPEERRARMQSEEVRQQFDERERKVLADVDRFLLGGEDAPDDLPENELEEQ